MIYSENIAACAPKTCKSLRQVSAFSASYCKSAPEYTGCTCRDGLLLLESEQRCVEEVKCPCVRRAFFWYSHEKYLPKVYSNRLKISAFWDNGKMYEPGAEITKGCMTCTCGGINWDCSEDKCSSKCVSYGNPHYLTFDGKFYDFEGPCNYILARSLYRMFYKRRLLGGALFWACCSSWSSCEYQFRFLFGVLKCRKYDYMVSALKFRQRLFS